jgi:cytochrome P450
MLTASRRLPGPPAMPVLGARGNLMRFFREPIAYMERLYRTYGKVVGLARDYDRTVFAFGPEYNRQILTNQDLFHNPSALLFPTPEDSSARKLDQGMISINGAQHKQQRALAMPAFHKQHVDTYRDDIVALTAGVLDRWQARAKQHGAPPLDVAREMQRITLRIVNKTLFGLDPSPQADAFGAMTQRWQAMLLSPAVIFFPVDLPGTPYRLALAHAERLEAHYRALIARKRADSAGQRDALALLMAARDEEGRGLTDAELIGQANVLFIAGHDTSSNALTWTLFLLAQHPAVLHALVDELEGTLHGGAPTIEHLRPGSGHLPLLDQVIKESMRVLPAIPVVARITTAPCTLGPHAIPAGAWVFFGQYMTHHLPELYPEPMRFLPERWTMIEPSAYEYLPFGAGPRRCLGATLAMMLLKIVLAMTLQRYRLTLSPGARVDYQVHITMSPRGGMPMIVAPQDRRFRRSEMSGTVRQMIDWS